MITSIFIFVALLAVAVYAIYRTIVIASSAGDEEELALGIGAPVEANVMTQTEFSQLPQANVCYSISDDYWTNISSDLMDLVPPSVHFIDDEITGGIQTEFFVGLKQVTPDAWKWSLWVHGRQLAEKNIAIERGNNND